MPQSVVLYAGTTDGIARYCVGEGGHWTRARHALAGKCVRALLLADADTLLASVDDAGALQSFDGGHTWSQAREAPPQPPGLEAMTINGAVPLANPRLRGATAYARLAGQPGTLLGAGAGGMLLFRSNDDGIHWQPAQLDAASEGTITTLIPDAARPTAAWAGTSVGVILRSADRGVSWRIVAREPVGILCLACAVGTD
jgi:photosystem II stability/assembly factor-like uncharacterized protein